MVPAQGPGECSGVSGARCVSVLTTSPIYVTVNEQPIRSDEDARYFIAWLDRLRAGVQANTDWNSEADKESTLDLIARARQEFERRLSQ